MPTTCLSRTEPLPYASHTLKKQKKKKKKKKNRTDIEINRQKKQTTRAPCLASNMPASHGTVTLCVSYAEKAKEKEKEKEKEK